MGAWLRNYAGMEWSGLPRPTSSDWIFALRTTMAGFVALLVAYALDLEHPQWAMMTVFIVAQPVAGMVLAKGFFRLLGTLAGALAAVCLSRILGESPWVFITVLSLWIGLCTYVSTLLRNPEAYGAALAGYTATIIGLPAFGHPHLVTELAAARCTEIVIGIACAGITSRLLLPQLARDAMREKLQRCVIDLAAYASGAFGSENATKLDTLHRKLIADAQALGEMRTYARLEAPSMATRARPVRRTIGFLLSALSAARMLRTYTAPQNPDLMPVRRDLKSVVEDLTKATDLEDVRPWVERFQAVSGSAGNKRDHADNVGTLSRLTIAGEFADALKEVLLGLEALQAPAARRVPERRQPALIIHRDHHAAWRNAARATVATMLMAAFWLTTQWAEAAGVVIIVAVVASLFAPRPSPVQVAWGFFEGTLLALPFAFLVGQILLPALPGFGWFVLFVVPIMVPAALAMANPRLVGVATAFAINFLAFLSPQKVMVYNPAEFLGSAGSILIGILLAIGVFLVVLPSDPWKTARHIAQAICEDLVRLCLHERIPRRSAFESLAYDRINQLMSLMPSLGRKGDAWLGGSIMAVTVGLEILRLRNTAQAGAISAEASQAIDNFLKRLAHQFLISRSHQDWQGSVSAIREKAESIAAGSHDMAILRVAASMRVIAAAIEDHPEFFSAKAA